MVHPHLAVRRALSFHLSHTSIFNFKDFDLHFIVLLILEATSARLSQPCIVELIDVLPTSFPFRLALQALFPHSVRLEAILTLTQSGPRPERTTTPDRSLHHARPSLDPPLRRLQCLTPYQRSLPAVPLWLRAGLRQPQLLARAHEPHVRRGLGQQQHPLSAIPQGVHGQVQVRASPRCQLRAAPPCCLDRLARSVSCFAGSVHASDCTRPLQVRPLWSSRLPRCSFHQRSCDSC